MCNRAKKKTFAKFLNNGTLKGMSYVSLFRRTFAKTNVITNVERVMLMVVIPLEQTPFQKTYSVYPLEQFIRRIIHSSITPTHRKSILSTVHSKEIFP